MSTKDKDVLLFWDLDKWPGVFEVERIPLIEYNRLRQSLIIFGKYFFYVLHHKSCTKQTSNLLS
jgi:hypothetical protein